MTTGLLVYFSNKLQLWVIANYLEHKYTSQLMCLRLGVFKNSFHQPIQTTFLFLFCTRGAALTSNTKKNELRPCCQFWPGWNQPVLEYPYLKHVGSVSSSCLTSRSDLIHHWCCTWIPLLKTSWQCKFILCDIVISLIIDVIEDMVYRLTSY